MNNRFNTKKYLGQHLLINEDVIKNIINNASNLENINVIEIGPGTGNLTKYLLQSAKSVTSIEKDKDTEIYLSKLKTQFPNNFNYILNDALNIDLSKLVDMPKAIIANLPYNIGTELFLRWLKIAKEFEYFILMFQKEVALRICGKSNSKNYGRLTLYTKIYGTATYLFDVPKQDFMPPPKVDSAVIKFIPFSKPLDINIKSFEEITSTAFSCRRKIIKNSLKNFNFDFNALNINPEKRPEELSFNEFCNLVKAYDSKT